MVGLLRSETADDPRADVLVTGVNERNRVAVRARGLRTRRRSKTLRASSGAVIARRLARRACSEPAAAANGPRRRSRGPTCPAAAASAAGQARRVASSRSPRSWSGIAAVFGCGRVRRRGFDQPRLRSRRASRSVERLQLVRLRRERLPARLDPRREEPPADGAGADGPWMSRSTVAIEDRRFPARGRRHRGNRAGLVNDVRAARVVEGGSTITQQLVRNLYIRHTSARCRRKVVEACLAVKLSRNGRRTGSWPST